MTAAWHRARPAVACALALAVVMVACTGGSEPVAAPSPARSPTPPPPPPMVAAPLTGMMVRADARFLSRPALAVKVENSTAARPQSGLEFADLVYEELVEGGITRFIAVFHSRDADPLGPVRSARPEDPDIVREHRGLLAYSGAAFYVKRLIRDTPGIGSLRHGEAPSAYYRNRSRPAPHNLYSSTRALHRAGRRYGLPPAAAAFRYDLALPAPPAPTGAQEPGPSPAAEPRWPRGRLATVDFSGAAYRATWQYERVSRDYLRSHGAAPHQSASGRQLRARNVLLVFVRVRSAAQLDARHGGTPISIVTGTGRAILLRDGARIDARWSRPSLAAGTRFETEDGELVLAPGSTWIELVPTGRSVTVR